MSNLPPVRREILAPAEPDRAFKVFTADIGRWWPLAEHSVYGGDATVSFVNDQIIERSPGGEQAIWGTVTSWEPGSRVAFTWHPGRAVERATHVAVSFAPAEGGTLVTLVHTGWEVFDDPEAARRDYDDNWPGVLDCYRDQLRE